MAKTILIVEDDGFLALHLQMTLDRLGYAVLGPVASGEEALALLQDQAADLILMDIELAGAMNGIETAEAIGRAGDTPILFLTGHSQESLLEQAKSVAPYGYLIKPVSEREVAASVAMALQRHALHRELEHSRASLAKSEARYHHIFDHSPIGIFRTTLGGKVLEANPALTRFLGYDSPAAFFEEQQLTASNFYLHPETRSSLLTQLHRNRAVNNFEFQAKKRHGQNAWVSMSAKLSEAADVPEVSDPWVIDGFAVDITERKRIENVQSFLAQASTGSGSEPFFHALARHLAENLCMDFICIDRLEGDGLTAQTVAIWHDGRFEDNIRYTLTDTPCGEVVGKVVCCFPSGVARRFPHDQVLQEMRAESYVGVTLWDHIGHPIGLIAAIGRRPLAEPQMTETVLHMVAARAAGELERQMAEQALLASEQRFRSYFEMGLIGMATTSADKRYLHFNDRLCEILGYPREELARKTWTELTHPDDLAADLARFQRVERGETDTFHTEKRFLRKDGATVHTEVLSRCIRNPDGSINHMVAMVQDISPRKLAEERAKKLQSQLLQSQKLEAIGTLAGGIAHDFNNILAAIIGYTDMAREMTPPGTPLAKDLDQVLKAGHRAKDLVQQILVFSRQNETEPIVLYPASIVKEVIKLLRPSLPTTIAIEERINPKAGPIHIDPTQLHQILMNLGTNAYHAMEETGGTLKIGLQAVTFDAGNLPDVAHARPGDFVEILVGDTGTGIAEEIRERIFDPFFTTKEMGKGTGMGLSIVHGTVSAYNGFLVMDSQPGHGTTFHVYLPVVATEQLGNTVQTDPAPRGSEHILFVDDELALAEMVTSMLERLGYRVTMHTRSQEALTAFQQHPDLFDLVITDQTMPTMTGLDLARRILAVRPQMPIILCTGFSSQISEEKAKAHGIREFAFKPLTKKDLATLIRKALTRP
jgi:PAS domain S-box-containing protein